MKPAPRLDTRLPNRPVKISREKKNSINSLNGFITRRRKMDLLHKHGFPAATFLARLVRNETALV